MSKQERISAYSFGSITVDGETYSKDVIILPDRVISPWWRKEGHILQAADLEEVAGAGIPVLVVGTGFYGAMKVPEQTLGYIGSLGITVYIEQSKKAAGLFNELSEKSPVIGAFHLTC